MVNKMYSFTETITKGNKCVVFLLQTRYCTAMRQCTAYKGHPQQLFNSKWMLHTPNLNYK